MISIEIEPRIEYPLDTRKIAAVAFNATAKDCSGKWFALFTAYLDDSGTDR